MSAYDAVAKLVVGDRVDERLQRESGAPASRAMQRADRREVAAGTVAGDRERVTASPSNSDALRGDPLQRGPAVVERRRERVLGREPVLDRHDDRARCVRERSGRSCRRRRRCRSSSRRRGSTRRPAGCRPPTAGTRAPERRRRRDRRPRIDVGSPAARTGVQHRETVARLLQLLVGRGRPPIAFTMSQSCWACGCSGTRQPISKTSLHARRPQGPMPPARGRGTRACRRSRGTRRRRADLDVATRCCRRRPYASPWSRSGSYSAVMTTAARQTRE